MGVCVEEPIVLDHWQSGAAQGVHIRHLIIAQAGAEASVVESFNGAVDTCYFTNVITEIHLAEQSKLTHYLLQEEGHQAFHIGHLAVQQAHSSEFNSHLLGIGGRLVRRDLVIDLDHEYAKCSMNGIYIPADNQHQDYHTKVSHKVPNCRSKQDYKGVLKGHSRAVFNGKVLVERDAQHTEAHQQNKNLLLSANAEIDTKPQLEIFADDVVCSHGATVGQLDDNALFYLQSRGLEVEEAQRYLIHAFVIDNLRQVPNKLLADWMTGLINQQLGEL